MPMMRAAIFVEPGRIVLKDKTIPDVGPLDALIRITTTTICGTDVHILKGEYPVVPGLTIGHEPVGFIEKLGAAVTRFSEGQRVIAGAMSNLSPIPEGLTDDQVLMCLDIMSTGFSGAEKGGIRIGDMVAFFAQGPIGLCATAGAKLMGASTIIAVDALPNRLAMAKRLGADYVVDYTKVNPVDEIMRLTVRRGVDVAIEALGTQGTFASALRVLRPGGTLSSLGVLFHRSDHSRRGLCRRSGRPYHRHLAVSGRQGMDAPPDGDHRNRAGRSGGDGHTPLQSG